MFTVSILLMCINWMQFNHLQIPGDEIIHYGHETPVPPRRFQSTVFVQNHTDLVTSAIHKAPNNTDPSKVKGDIPLLKRNHTLSKSFLKMIDWKSRIPETKEHLMNLSRSPEVDVEDLGMYLSNKSAYVYNMGTITARGVTEDTNVLLDST